MKNKKPKTLTECKQFFLEPKLPRQRIYEALRAYFVDELRSKDAAKAFGYTEGSFRVLCHDFKHDPDPNFFIKNRPGPTEQPKKSAAHDLIIELRKLNYSVYEISETLKDKNMGLSPTAVREVLKEEGFSALPRRLDEERPIFPRPTVEPEANIQAFNLKPRKFTTSCGGLFLFLPFLVQLDLDGIAREAVLPGSKKIPREHALRACLALKLWSIERKRHVMALAADEGLGLFCGLNVTPKKSFLSEYSSRIEHTKTMKMLSAWHKRTTTEKLYPGQSFDLDFHSVPYYGEDPIVEKNYVSMRSRSQPSVLVFMAQDANGQSFCYSNADIRKRERANEIFRFIEFWKSIHKENPRQLVFDSQLTTYKNLAELDEMNISFITLRRRTPRILEEVKNLPDSAWRVAKLDVPNRKYKTPKYIETKVQLVGHTYRQFYIKDLGHEQPTILLTNEKSLTPVKLIVRYAKRMLIENALSDAVRFFHMDALSASVGMKVDFDMALLVIASGLYRMMARKMRGYRDAHARNIFRDLVDIPADVTISNNQVNVHFHRRSHLPILLASGMMNNAISIPWWGGYSLVLSGE